MTTSKGDYGHSLCSLSFETVSDYDKNLQTLLKLIHLNAPKSIIVAPEVCLTSFDYEHLDAATNFSTTATKQLLEVCADKTIILTMLQKDAKGDVYNMLKVFHNGKVVYQRPKIRLFHLGNEQKYMLQGSDSTFEIVEIDNIKLAVFVCFELRFKELWEKSEGADIIAVSSWWGKPRSEHFVSLTQALAIMNQCYVVASDSKNEECTAYNAVITPQGKVHSSEDEPFVPYKKKEIELMRRYIDVGLGSKC